MNLPESVPLGVTASQSLIVTHDLTVLAALPLETWVAMHEDLRESPRCKVTFQALVEGLIAYLG